MKKYGFYVGLLALSGMLLALSGCSSGSGNVYLNEIKNAELVPVFNSHEHRYMYVKSDGSTVTLPDSVESPAIFHSGLAVVLDSRTNLKGYVGTDGKWKIEPRYAEASDFSEGLA